MLTPYVKDKDFLRRLAKTYQNLETLNAQLERYANMKASGLNEMLANIKEKELERWSNGSVYDLFQIPLGYKAYRSFFYVGGTIIDPTLFERCQQTILSMIEEIEGNYPE